MIPELRSQQAAADCAAGGLPVSGAPGYVAFGRTDLQAEAGFFSPFVDLPIADATLARRNPDPCGDAQTLISGVPADAANLPRIKVPVLLVFANNDALYSVVASAQQAKHYINARSVTRVILPRSGHAVTLDADRVLLQQTVAGWLARQGL